MSRKFVYRLSGFSAVLDLRPVEFEGRLADVRACSVCDVLPEKVAFLPCGHLLCGSCFGGSVARGHICALDGRLFDECLVEWLNFTEEWLAKTNVFCWNTESGCDFVGPVMTMPDHYSGQCHFHSVSCPRCKQSVLQSDIVRHRHEDCRPTCARDIQSEERSPGSLLAVTQALDELSGKTSDLQSSVTVLVDSVWSECFSLRETMSLEGVRHSEQYTETAAGISSLEKKLDGVVDHVKISLEEYVGKLLSGGASGASGEAVKN